MDLSAFPLEVLEVLARYLSAEDLSACSAVSASWRQAFNLDLFWRKHCEKHIVGYLQKELGQVEPWFRRPRNLESLQPLCDWRVQVMRKTHLFRNWNKGRYVMQKIKLEAPIVNCTMGMDSTSNHWLVVNLGDRTEVWNLQTTPQFHATVGNITGAPSYLQIVGDKLIIVDFYYFVQVFHLKLPTVGFTPSSKFFYSDSEQLFVNLADNEERNSVRDRLRSCFRKGHVVFVVDYLLVGYCSYVEAPNEQFLHIWDLETETKVSQETVLSALNYKLRTYSCSVYISADSKSKQLLCSLYLFDKYVSKLIIYNLKYRKFTDFSLTVSGKVDWCDISEGLVATSHLLHQLHIYSASTGDLVNILDTNARMVFGPNSGLEYQVMGSYMVQPSRESVKVINIYEYWDSLLLYFYSVYKVIPIPPQFLAVSARPYASSDKMVLEVWNVKDKVLMFDYCIAQSECPAYHMIEPLLTKTAVAIGKTVNLLSFW